MRTVEVIRLRNSQIVEASEIAAKAFKEDPVFQYLTHEESEIRFQILTWLMSEIISHLTQYNQVYTTSDLQGISAWLPPGKSPHNLLQILQIAVQLQLYALPLKVGLRRSRRWLNFLAKIEQFHQQDMGGRAHWYLGIMVVNPSYQGQGVGSDLLQPILRRASEEGLECYLVTFTTQAVQFYQKNGFEVVRNQKLASDAPPIWTLKRNP